MAVALIGGLFVHDNAEFFAKADEQIKAGYEWNLIKCREPIPGALSIPLINQETGKKTVCFKLEK